MVVKDRPIRINFSEIHWGEIVFNTSCHIDDIEYTEIQGIQTNINGDTVTTLIEKENLAEKALTKLQNNSDLLKLYGQYILRKFTPQQGERNSLKQVFFNNR